MRKCFSPYRLLPLAAALAATSAMALTAMTAPATARPAATSTTTGTTSGTTTGGTTTGTTSVSALNATTVIPTQITPASRTASGGTTPEQTSGTSQSGTSTGDAFSGSSRGDAPAVGEAAANAFTNTGTTATNPTGVFNGPTGIPIVVDNGTVAANGAVTVNGERIAANPSLAGADLGYAGSAVVVPQVGVATSNVAIAADPGVRKELRKRQNLPRNGQLLYSIAPRTSADRGWQMPDDPVSPALRPPA